MRASIAYLCSSDTIRSSATRRQDAFEHDRAFSTLSRAFGQFSRELVEVVWDEPDEDWSRYEAALVGSTWDYSSRLSQYLSALNNISKQTKLLNPYEAIVWNTNKLYLRKLNAQGVALAPTVWPESCSYDALLALSHGHPSTKLIAKPLIGACSEGQRLFTLEETADLRWIRNDGMMVQRFYEHIASEGELSLVFFGSKLSHAIRKMPARGDYRVQSLFNGTERLCKPGRQHIAFAKKVIQLIPFPTLYSRVDLFQTSERELVMMELEISEAYLYPDLAPDGCLELVRRYTDMRAL